MHQLSLFNLSETEFAKEVNNENWFRMMLQSLSVEYIPGWPDSFGQSLRHWLQQHDHQAIKMLSLFSGGGGLDIGFADAGFHAINMIEIEKKYIKTLELNSDIGKRFAGSKPLRQDIKTYTPSDDFKVDFIIGGPPCQTFSAAGRRAAGVLGTNDPRGTLFEDYVRLLIKLKPKGFLFENVYGITGAQNGEAWEEIKTAFKSAGYDITYRILDTADYGVPQHRERIFIVGLQEETDFLFPYPTHGPDSESDEPYFTAANAVQGADTTDAILGLGGQYGNLLDDIPPGLNYSFYTEKMGHPRPVFGWRSKFSDFLYKADPDAPVRTIKAQGGQYTGPFSWENRPFTLSEFKRLQTIPDDYEIVGNRQTSIEQIGNSVPPQMARMLALSILDQVFEVSLPFAMRYLPQEKGLGFRQRKRQKTNDYMLKAQEAIDKLKTSEPSQQIVTLATNQQTTRYLSANFSWTASRSKYANSKNIRVHFDLQPEEWKIYTQTVDLGMDFYTSYEIVLLPSEAKGWKLPKHGIKLIAGDYERETFTALWKAFEEKLLEVTGVADLVQLNGYYQYTPKVRAKLTLIRSNDDLFWKVIVSVVKGVGVGKQMREEEFARLFEISTADVLPTLEQLRTVGYEIRNHNTNSQIQRGDYLIPYAFPTLTPRSVQLRKTLRESQ